MTEDCEEEDISEKKFFEKHFNFTHILFMIHCMLLLYSTVWYPHKNDLPRKSSS